MKSQMIERKTKITASDKFVTVLALVSIIGFAGIVSYTLFEVNINSYLEPIWMTIIGIGFIIEGQFGTLKRIREEGLNPTNFTHLITLIIGVMAIISGIFSIPQIRIETTGFLAMKGILALVAIVVIIVQTWLVK
ncbi:hypothetical protein J4416_01775 [Candidatus Pacearchaeota archaeon]|nr:hypothetical protein [Candidatus Pacearchaeota archaeon]HLC73308.1 hypothetical protein [Candidatus Nanoarchaeia archaeon]